MRVLFFGTYDAQHHPRVEVLQQGMRAHGVEVHECNEPLPLSTADRVALLRRPWTLPVLFWHLARCWVRLFRASAPWRRRDHRPDAVVVGYLGHFDVLLARALFRHTPIVLDHLIGASSTASDRGVQGGVRQMLLRALDSVALRSATLAIVDTQEHLDTLPPRARDRGMVVLVGAPDEWLATEAAAPSSPLRVVFFGLFTPLQGCRTIGEAIALLVGAPIEFTMIGTGQDYDETRAAVGDGAAVTWIDWVDGHELPVVVASHDVCLGIFGTTPKALRVVPNKVYQGAAAGCAVVTSDTPPQRRVLGDAAVLVTPGDAAGLAAALRVLAEDPAALARVRAAGSELAHRAFSPTVVTADLVRRLDPARTEPRA